jgi:glycosyltransferase involved in cell wall biosynthesis
LSEAPGVSVVLSVYDGARHLAHTMDSILSQSERDFELVVVDDGSTDATPQILRDYASRDRRIRVITQPNAGLTRALIVGCAAARASLIARHDAGDVSHPQRLEKQRRMLDAAPEVVFVSCATQYLGPEEEPLWIAYPRGAALEPADILDLPSPLIIRDGPTHHGSVMFRRDVYERVGGYREAFWYSQDFDLWFRFAEIGKFQTTNEVLYTARIEAESISSLARGRQFRLSRLSRATLEARQRGEREDTILAEAAAIRPQRGRTTRRARAAGLYFIGEALRRNDDRRARQYLRRAIATWPLSARAWIRLLQSLRIGGAR